VEKQAMLTVCCGSADNVYSLNNRIVQNHEGIAHFLEHKLFEDKDNALFGRFTQLGGSVNAFTTFNQTAYYVSCIDNFEENLKLLLNFCQRPYITDENVEKEKGIISQEIKMYDDTPSWRAYSNLNAALFGGGALAQNITGSVESIQGIDSKELLSFYHAFYFPANMALICVGDIDPEKAADIAAAHIEHKPVNQIKRGYEMDAADAARGYAELSMPVSMPLFELGFKETDFDTAPCTRIVSGKLLLDMIAGESSDLYERMYNENLIDDSFGMDYLSGPFYGVSVFSGSSPDPERVRTHIMNEIGCLRRGKLNRRRFESIKRKHMGRFIRGFNNIGQIAQTQSDLYIKGLDIFELMDRFANITFDEVQERLSRHFNESESALSVVKSSV
jgi:predicted Zn-dependent peptidase